MKDLKHRSNYDFFISYQDHLKEVKGLNESEVKIVSEIYSRIMLKMNNKSELQKTNIFIKNYKSEDIGEWVNNYKQITTEEDLNKFEDELLSVICQNVMLNFNYYPNSIQILSLIIFITKKNESGRICEIKTGEGKSLIIAMLASYLSLKKKKKVHVITSSSILAERDSREFKKFYQCLLSRNGNNTSGLKYSYDSQIMYGTNSSFQADILRTEYKGQMEHAKTFKI
jgi:preprotein translocase subunit SecA